MTEDQRNRLQALVYPMKVMARRKVTENEKQKGINLAIDLQDFLHGHESRRTAEEWISIAEKAAEGHDNPGIVRMPSMAAVLSGMPPEHKGAE
jgi:hypothetical protein